jgi:hypothetical protein
MELILNSKFYKLNAIEKAIKDFKDYSIKLTDKKKYAVEFNCADKKELEILKREFANYVLGLMKNEL